jgi:hypothetical protein
VLPGKHATHADGVDRPGVGLALPRGHRRHAALVDAPSSGLYMPLGHKRLSQARCADRAAIAATWTDRTLARPRIVGEGACGTPAASGTRALLSTGGAKARVKPDLRGCERRGLVSTRRYAVHAWLAGSLLYDPGEHCAWRDSFRVA